MCDNGLNRLRLLDKPKFLLVSSMTCLWFEVIWQLHFLLFLCKSEVFYCNFLFLYRCIYGLFVFVLWLYMSLESWSCDLAVPIVYFGWGIGEAVGLEILKHIEESNDIYVVFIKLINVLNLAIESLDRCHISFVRCEWVLYIFWYISHSLLPVVSLEYSSLTSHICSHICYMQGDG